MANPVHWAVHPGYAGYVLVGVGPLVVRITEDGKADGSFVPLHFLPIEEARKLAVELAIVCDFQKPEEPGDNAVVAS